MNSFRLARQRGQRMSPTDDSTVLALQAGQNHVLPTANGRGFETGGRTRSSKHSTSSDASSDESGMSPTTQRSGSRSRRMLQRGQYMASRASRLANVAGLSSAGRAKREPWLLQAVVGRRPLRALTRVGTTASEPPWVRSRDGRSAVRGFGRGRLARSLGSARPPRL